MASTTMIIIIIQDKNIGSSFVMLIYLNSFINYDEFCNQYYKPVLQ